jgi:hypothetical protein
MPVLPAGYANSNTPLYETNEDPDPVQGIVGLNGVGVSRVGDNVFIQPLAPFTVSGSTGVNGNLVIDQVFTSSFTNTAGGFEFNPAPSSGFRVDVVSDSNESLGVRIMNGATGATGIVGMLLDTADQALELVAPDSNKIRVYADTGSGNGFKLLPGSTGGAGGLTISNGATGALPSEFVFYNATVSGGGLDAGHLALYGYSGGSDALILDAQPDGSNIILGDGAVVGGAVVEVSGTKGGSQLTSRVNDPVFNPAVSNVGVILTTSNTIVPAGNPGYFTASQTPLEPGLYMLQCEVKMDNSGSFSIPAPGSLLFYIADQNGTNFKTFSEIDITNTMLIQPVPNTANEPSFTSAVFTITSAQDITVGYEIDGTWNLGTDGNIDFQIIKLA